MWPCRFVCFACFSLFPLPLPSLWERKKKGREGAGRKQTRARSLPPRETKKEKEVSPPLFSPSLNASRTVRETSRLTVGLLEARAGTLTTELLGLAAAVVGDEEGTVELDEGLLEQVLGVLVDELLVVGDEGLGNGLTDGVDLRGVTTTGDADADVDVGELVEADDEERLVDLWRERRQR